MGLYRKKGGLDPQGSGLDIMGDRQAGSEDRRELFANTIHDIKTRIRSPFLERAMDDVPEF